jgi:hypothetical protein
MLLLIDLAVIIKGNEGGCITNPPWLQVQEKTFRVWPMPRMRKLDLGNKRKHPMADQNDGALSGNLSSDGGNPHNAPPRRLKKRHDGTSDREADGEKRQRRIGRYEGSPVPRRWEEYDDDSHRGRDY